MPYFSEYTEVEVDIKITPEEFVSSCSEKEIQQLIRYLNKEGYLEGDEFNPTHPIANEFYQNINKIKHNRLVLTAEEDEMLREIASRF